MIVTSTGLFILDLMRAVNLTAQIVEDPEWYVESRQNGRAIEMTG